MFTARTMTDMSTLAPGGMPREHADGSALPRAMFSNRTKSAMSTLRWAPQSPAQGIGVLVGIGLAVFVAVDVAVAVGVWVQVSVCVGVVVGV